MLKTASSARPLIVTIYGAFGRSMGGWLAVADLVGLLAELGVDGQAARSAIARLKQSGHLAREVHSDRAGYSATPALLDILRDGDDRLFNSSSAADVRDGWVVVAFSVPESQRQQRHLLRTRLAALGCGPLGPGVWIGPRRVEGDLRRMLESLALQQYVSLFGGDYLGFSKLSELVAAAWDVRPLHRHFQKFVTKYQRPTTRAVMVPERAFVAYVALLEQWRHLVYQDPGLPDAFTPYADLRRRAAELFATRRAELAHRAEAHVKAIVR